MRPRQLKNDVEPPKPQPVAARPVLKSVRRPAPPKAAPRPVAKVVKKPEPIKILTRLVPKKEKKPVKAKAAPKPVAKTEVAKIVPRKPLVARTQKKENPLIPIIGLVLLIVMVVALLFVQYGNRISWPRMNFPTISIPHISLPDITLPEMPHWFSAEPSNPNPNTDPLSGISQPQPQTFPQRGGSESMQLRNQLAEAEERIRQLEAVMQEKDKTIQREITLRGQTMLAQYARLIEHALNEGLPFPWELEQLQRFSDSHLPEAAPLIQALAPYAPGVASLPKLKEEFEPISDEVYLRWKKESSGGGFSATIASMMHQIITVRRVGMVDGTTPEAVLARTQYYLDRNDLAKATQELSALSAGYGSLVNQWLEEAHQRLEALKYTNALHNLAQKASPGVKSVSPVTPANSATDLSEPAPVEPGAEPAATVPQVEIP